MPGPALFSVIEPKEWPEVLPYAAKIGKYPGGVHVEYFLLDGMRIAACGALVGGPLLWVGRRWRVLNKAKRDNILLRVALQDCMAYGAMAGFASGLGVGVGDGVARFSTVDEVVKRAVALRANKDHDRWAHNMARCVVAGILYTVAFVHGKSLAYRVALGAGWGTALSIPMSLTKFDQALNMM